MYYILCNISNKRDIFNKILIRKLLYLPKFTIIFTNVSHYFQKKYVYIFFQIHFAYFCTIYDF